MGQKTEAIPKERLATAKGCVCMNLRKASRVITQHFDKMLRPCGLRTTQFTLLVALRSSCPISMTLLAERLSMDRTTLTRNLKPLEEKSWVKTQGGLDQRMREISITQEGEKVLAKAFPVWEKTQSKFFDGLGESNWLATMKTLSEIMSLTE